MQILQIKKREREGERERERERERREREEIKFSNARICVYERQFEKKHPKNQFFVRIFGDFSKFQDFCLEFVLFL